MISNDLVQAALIAKANSTPAIQTHLPSGTITEFNYQGTDWSYPCGRLEMERQIYAGESNESCPSVVEFSWYIFSEQFTSKQANQIAGAFLQGFEDLSFEQNNIKFSKVKILENIPAIRQDVRTWRAQIRCRSTVHSA